MDICCDGVVIRETPFGENDKVLTVLTAQYGKITVYAKGVRSMKSKNSSAVQLFCASSFELTEKNGKYTLKTALLNESFYSLRDDIERFALGSYVVEVANTVCSENNDESGMLRLVKNTLYAISELCDIPLWKIKAVFELKCMTENGLAPEAFVCGDCGESIHDGKEGFCDNHGKILFSCVEGCAICDDCAKKRQPSGQVKISISVAEVMKYIINSPQTKMLKLPIALDKAETDELCVACEKYLIFQTSRKYDTLAFYKSLSVMK